MDDLVSEYQQYQDATVDDDAEFDDGEYEAEPRPLSWKKKSLRNLHNIVLQVT